VENVANLFGKLFAKFHPNGQSFVEDITKNNLVSFFRIHCGDTSQISVYLENRSAVI